MLGVLTITKTNKCFYVQEKEAEVLEGISESKSKYRKIVQAGIAQWIKSFQEGNIKIETVDDLKKLIDIDMDLQQVDLINTRRFKRIND